MPTGNVNSKRSNGRRSRSPASFSEPRAVGVRFEPGRLIVSLADEREVSVPLAWYPTLHRAAPRQRSRWKLIGQGRNQGFHWPDLDLDLSVAGLMNGLAEAIPRPPELAGATATRRGRKSA